MTNDDYKPVNSYDSKSLQEQADELLNAAGFTIFGEKKDNKDFRQTAFEARMRTGAFSRGGGSNRKKA